MDLLKLVCPVSNWFINFARGFLTPVKPEGGDKARLVLEACVFRGNSNTIPG
jgi:hypothetical protein